MAKFYVGQRVKLVRYAGDKWMGDETGVPSIGTEGRIDEVLFIPAGSIIASSDYYDYCLSVDCHYVCSLDGHGDSWAVNETEIEPLQPEGWKKISWEEMKDLWTPKEISHV